MWWRPSTPPLTVRIDERHYVIRCSVGYVDPPS
jgi:hypothetical protein